MNSASRATAIGGLILGMASDSLRMGCGGPAYLARRAPPTRTPRPSAPQAAPRHAPRRWQIQVRPSDAASCRAELLDAYGPSNSVRYRGASAPRLRDEGLL